MPDINRSGLKRAALMNDLSCFGKCSLSVGLPILSAAGVEAALLPTAVLSTHTGGFSGYTCLDMTGELERILAHWKTLDMHFDGIATGYFCGGAQLALAQRFVKEFSAGDTVVLVDPVMADGGRLYPGFAPEFVQGMRGLCGMADLITPNLTEACLLADLPFAEIPGPALTEECLARLLAGGARAAVITGVCRQGAAGREIGYVCRQAGGETFSVWHPRVETALHGCGDVFSSALLAALLCGRPFENAVRAAAGFTERCVLATDTARWPGHWYGLRFEEVLAGGLWNAGSEKQKENGDDRA